MEKPLKIFFGVYSINCIFEGIIEEIPSLFARAGNKFLHDFLKKTAENNSEGIRGKVYEIISEGIHGIFMIFGRNLGMISKRNSLRNSSRNS